MGRHGTTYECVDCGWQGEHYRTDGSLCPECHGDVVPVSDDDPQPETAAE